MLYFSILLKPNSVLFFFPPCFSPPGLPDVARPQEPGVPDERALHHPWKRWPALASSRPAQRPRLPAAPRQRPPLRRRQGGGAIPGAGDGAGDPEWESQWPLRAAARGGGAWTPPCVEKKVSLLTAESTASSANHLLWKSTAFTKRRKKKLTFKYLLFFGEFHSRLLKFEKYFWNFLNYNIKLLSTMSLKRMS